MGWWKCNKGGGIDWENKPSGHPGSHALINAVPKRDTVEDYYNGDAPADAMFIPTAVIRSWFVNREPKPTTKQLTKLFTDKVFDDVFRHIDRQQLTDLIDGTWKRIDEIYRECWNRNAYPEERRYVCLFSFGGANRINTDWPDWWKISNSDKLWLTMYSEGKWL